MAQTVPDFVFLQFLMTKYTQSSGKYTNNSNNQNIHD